eukprot:scaffold6008_cov118-Isochrysis_galbana.AAC.2
MKLGISTAVAVASPSSTASEKIADIGTHGASDGQGGDAETSRFARRRPQGPAQDPAEHPSPPRKYPETLTPRARASATMCNT